MDDRSDDSERIEQLWTSLHDDLVRRGVDSATAADIAQETWLRATRRPPPDRARFRGWLQVVATRLLQQLRRKDARRAWQEWNAAQPSHYEVGPSERAESDRSHLRRSVEELSEPYRATLLLRFFEGRSVEEIAELRSIPAATVRTHLKRGLRKLRDRIGDGEESRDRVWTLLGAWWTRAAPRIGWAGVLVAVALVSWFFWKPSAISGTRSENAVVVVEPTGIPMETTPPPVLSTSSTEQSRENAALDVVAPTRPRILGVVRTPAGDPLPDALVHTESGGFGARAESTVVSDSFGRYEIDATSGLLWATHADWCSSPRAYVESIVDREAFDIVLAPTNGRVEVRVRSDDGNAVDGALVLIDPDKKHTQAGTSRGHLEISPLPPRASTDREGRAELVFPEAAFVDVTVIAAQRPFWSATIPTPRSGDVLDIALPASLSIRGRCSDFAGAPVLNARVELVQRKGLVHREATSDAYGAFRFDGLAQGEFTLRVSESTPPRRSARFDGVLDAGEEDLLELRLDERASILGRVVDRLAPVVGAKVELGMISSHAAEGNVRGAVTDADGRFFFGGCRLTVAHTLQISLPGDSAPCIGVDQLRPGRGETVHSVPDRTRGLAPIALEFVGSHSALPRLVEVRSLLPAFSVVLANDSGSQKFESPPLPARTYSIVGWWPDLGAWKLGKIVHDPMVHVTHRFSIPEVGTLSVSVEVPRGFQAQGAEALLPTEPFDRNVFGTFETFDGWRHLDWDDVEHAFVANLPVGNHALIIRGLGLSESHHSVRIDPGAVHTVRDSLERGVETTLVFLSALTEPELGRRMSRGMLPLDTLQLEVKTPTGTTMLQLPAKNQRMVERGFEFCIWLPESTTEVRAETRSHEERPTQRAPWKGLRKVEPGELDATSGARHRLEVVFSSQ